VGILALAPGFPASADEPPFPVKDINLLGAPQHSSPADFAVVNGTLFFSAEDEEHGRELWRSDGTASGTWRVADIVPGPEGSSPDHLADVGGVLFFAAWDAGSGRELWRSDGTAAGTQLAADLVPGPDSSSPEDISDANGLLVFTADDGVVGREIWGGDGTQAGTQLLADIRPGPDRSGAEYFTEMGGAVFFKARDDVLRSLWKSDGTAAGTVRLRDGLSVCDRWGSPNPAEKHVLVEVGGTLFFPGREGAYDCELWKSDGTIAGTVRVRDIYPGIYGSYPNWLVNVDGTLFFGAKEDSTGYGLWKSNGTEAGTVFVAETGPSLAENLDGTLFYATQGGVWKSDGTASGTVLVKEVTVDTGGSHGDAASVNGLYVFRGGERYYDAQLWRSDGTEAGTFQVPTPGLDLRDPKEFTAFGDLLVFRGNDSVGGKEPWLTDGTQAGTGRLLDIWPESGTGSGSYPSHFTRWNDGVAFLADDYLHGRELWLTDGTEAGTRLVKDIEPGLSGPFEAFEPFERLEALGYASLGVQREVSGERLFFNAAPQAEGAELWVTDGTEAGTALVKDICPLSGSAYLLIWCVESDGSSSQTGPFALTDVDGTLFFYADDGVTGYELWRSDGTEVGTALVKDVNPGPYGSAIIHFYGFYPPELMGMNGTLFFTPFVTGTGWNLWESDGTEGGTKLSQEINPGGSSAARGLTDVDGTLFFSAWGEGVGHELWKSDGTDAGTTLVKDINPGPGPSTNLTMTAVIVNPPVTVNGVLFFEADDGTHGYELWKTDGTEAGTVLVKDIVPGPESPEIRELTSSGGFVFFTAETPETGREVWASDGTEVGTQLLADILPGPDDPWTYRLPAQLTGVNGLVYFIANTAQDGSVYELWRSNGTPEGTVRVVADDPAEGFSLPWLDQQFLGTSGELLFFVGGDDRGYELWALPVPECADGVDNDGDERVDYPEDPACAGPEGESELPRNDVEIDVIPHHEINRILAKPHFPVLVAILGSKRIDVRDVDVGTLAFGPGGASPAFPSARSFARRRKLPDVNRDGEEDLVVAFWYGETELPLGVGEACLRGVIAGQPFEACDAVVVFLPGCGLGFEVVLLLAPVLWLRTRRSRRAR
jgi:ELWxxDGT repeat protein